MSSLLSGVTPLNPDKRFPFQADDAEVRVDFRTLAVFDTLDITYAVFAVDGREIRRSPGATRLSGGAALWRQASRIIQSNLVPRGGAPLADGVTRRFRTLEPSLELVVAKLQEPTPEVRYVAVLVPRQSESKVVSLSNRWSLTPREMDLAELLQQGLSTKAIAEELGISVHTVRHHIESVFGKLGVRSRTSAAVILASSRATGGADGEPLASRGKANLQRGADQRGDRSRSSREAGTDE